MSFSPPTSAELAVVERVKIAFKEKVAEPSQGITDTAFLRFLRGSKGHVKNAVESLIKHDHWRKEENVDTIFERTSKFEKELNSGKAELGNFDKNGRPFTYCYARIHDAGNRDFEEMKLLIIYTLEYLRKNGKPEEERFVVCFDLERFTLKSMDYEVKRQSR